MLIAGHALSKNMPIVTHHLRALKRVSGLQIEDCLNNLRPFIILQIL